MEYGPDEKSRLHSEGLAIVHHTVHVGKPGRMRLRKLCREYADKYESKATCHPRYLNLS